jgi:hypothetical protein
MNKNVKTLFAILILALFAFALVSDAIVPNAKAAAIPKSSNVALVPGPYGQAENGGTLPTNETGDLVGGWPNGDTFTFSDLSPDTIMNSATDPLQAGGFDTVVFVQLYLTGDSYGSIPNYWANSAFNSRITNFVFNGGKLIIYDSEITTNTYTSFIYPFTSSNPGATGSGGQIWIAESNTLGSNSTTSATYLNANALCAPSIAETGDSNAMTSFDQNWRVHMVCTNVNGVTGPVHTYAEYGKGLIIFNGEDMDPMTGTEVNNNDVSGILGMIFYLELKQQWNPTGLQGTVGVSGIALTTTSTSAVIGTNHIVTVHITDSIANPVQGVTVNFKIDSGPNQGITGTGVTDANGETQFSWQSTTAGTDVISASAISPSNQTMTISSTTSVTWAQSQQVTSTPTTQPTSTPSPEATTSVFAGWMLWIIIVIIAVIVVVVVVTVLLVHRRKPTSQTMQSSFSPPPPPPP